MFDGSAGPQRGASGERCKIVLVSPYDLGRQPFALAEPAAWLARAGFEVACLDLSLQRLEPEVLAGARMVAVHVGMHTATRIAVGALPRIRRLAPDAHLCVYGLYAPMNEALLRGFGVHTVLGGECEPALLEAALAAREHREPPDAVPVVKLDKIGFVTPLRDGLPDLKRYAHLKLPGGRVKVSGFAEASRGCKHLCRHCPVVPVYQGRFRVIPVEVVLADIRQQAIMGAEHISFGDPDFFNGPTHALRVVRALHREFPRLTYDATIKIEHLVERADLLPELKRTGCLFVTSAAEAVDDRVLRFLAKNHTSVDFDRAVGLLRAAGIALAPTFVAFTPWTTLEGYLALLERVLALKLVAAVPPVQLSLRLLVPAGSYLFKLRGFHNMVGPFDDALLGFPWRHPDPRVDALQRKIQEFVARAGPEEPSRGAAFCEVWRMAHNAAGRAAPALDEADFGDEIPRLSEPWYCCAEPTNRQLAVL
ncbi:MAG: radical SAM protein [Betaproteobacteria bacterium]|nr:radical SAM protein [Betaproteobacteria bacterium]